MKKIIFIGVALFFCSSIVSAQEYKKFKLGLGVGYAMPTDGGGGVLAALEPAYRLTDEIALGLRLETAGMARAIGDNEADVAANASYTLNGQYYLSNSTFRPYIGFGFGVYTFASASVTYDTGGSTATTEVDSDTKVGFYPRVGFDLGHFNFNVDINLIPATDPDFSAGNLNLDEITNSYIGFRLGFFIFGGRN